MKNAFTYACVALMTLGLTACERSPSTEATNTSLAAKSPPAQVQVVRPRQGDPAEYVFVGSVVSDQRVDVTSRVTSYIQAIPVKEGDTVRRGQLLVQLDSADIDGATRQANAAAKATSAALLDAQADLDKFQRLFERGSASDNELRKVQLKRDATREGLNQAQAAVDTARSQRQYADIRSPVDGVVVARVKRPGDMALPGVPLLVVEAGDHLLFETSVAADALPVATVGKAVQVRLDSRKDPLQGTVLRVVSSADPMTRSHLVKIALPTTPGLVAGTFGRAAFAAGDSETLDIPQAAMTERGGLRGVFVVDDSRHARFRWLRTGREKSNRIEVTAGLKAQEWVVLAPLASLHDGDLVSPKENAGE